MLLLKSQADREEEDEQDGGGLGHGVQRDADEFETPLAEPYVNGGAEGDQRHPGEVVVPAQHDSGLSREVGQEWTGHSGKQEL